MANILIIDDDKMLCELMSRNVLYMGHSPETANTITDGIEKLKSVDVDVVFLDVNLPDGNGLNFINEICAMQSKPEVIIITGEGDPDGAELAFKSGAWDYLEKPVSIIKIELQISRVIKYREGKLTAPPPIALNLNNISGQSRAIKACYDLLAQASRSNANVLITGETGTGKELFAWAIHKNSSRAAKNFVVVDCAALPDTLAESVLFGHIKGAFTGADKAQDGLILQADGGTLFLDEIGELPLSVQKVFLRALQERKFRPVGGREEIRCDFRVIAATNRNLSDMADHGNFRKDLLFRINSICIELPPLRNRKEDIKLIVMHHLVQLCERNNIPSKGISPDFYEAFENYNWPGNVRELINTLESALVAARDDETLYTKHLPVNLRVSLAKGNINKKPEIKIEQNSHENPPSEINGISLYSDTDNSQPGSFKEFRNKALDKIEKEYIKRLIADSKNFKELCDISGLSKSRLYELFSKHNIPLHQIPKI